MIVCNVTVNRLNKSSKLYAPIILVNVMNINSQEQNKLQQVLANVVKWKHIATNEITVTPRGQDTKILITECGQSKFGHDRSVYRTNHPQAEHATSHI